MSRKENEVIREYIEESITTYKKSVPYKYYDLPVTKWYNFIPRNLKINKEITYEEVRDDRD